MFENLQDKLGRAFRLLSGKGRISEKNIEEAVKQVKLSLLEADVNYKVVKEFINGVTEKSLGEEVLKSFSPDQQFIKIVRDELINMLGERSSPLRLSSQPARIMMVGLQGSGKTTTSAKLATLLRKEGKKPLLVAADVYRPAAIDQLVQLGKQIDIPVFTGDRRNPVVIVKEAMQQAIKNINDVVILDTAGRLHIDDTMMSELKEIAALVKPDEILMVVDAMTGQDAVNSAKAFNEALELSGFVVTKLDGDARGGVILSIRHVTGKPVKFIGVSEKPDGLEVFYPDRVAGRILGLGDVLSLIDKIQANVDEEKAREMEEKFLKNKFDLEDFLDQLREIKKMGSIADILEMIPGAPKDVDLAGSEKSMKRTEAIIHSMTLKERRNPKLLNYSRKQRVARGSGTTIQDVNKLLKSYDQMKDMMKQFNRKGKLRKGIKGFPF
ncbi:MAG TPA: signal recognition particle protein [Mesotoga infera]|jgi:signal recognition particle subunit SRP54|uniref:Signal recognition particle protein n=1 Tax=Mesotoga infera TaxID=1236046 RepID=A0A7Z7PPC6_9BACT|nr:signal recognition particle protein [Mesotoga infera]MBP8659697.1 signal recognition particle protein [Mesotoga sp.]SSC13263.1 Signal Recognition Particle (SRP) component with 4.5S RNA (ffs) [Mesotoga infera]HNS66485.1 signal recognition particle protein [Mesotoga infera]HPD37123.1 signal recognition particle protein [Mesotoga infera]HRR43079.1 signal recognition particle protein [Mesotoga sp.]